MDVRFRWIWVLRVGCSMGSDDERAVYRRACNATEISNLKCSLLSAAFGIVPSEQSHPEQQERFTFG